MYCVRARLVRWATISREAWVYSEQFVIIRFILNCPSTARLTRQTTFVLSIQIIFWIFKLVLSIHKYQNKMVWQQKFGKYSGKVGIIMGPKKSRWSFVKRVTRYPADGLDGLWSRRDSYLPQYKQHIDKCNESKEENKVNREFSNQPPYNIVVSDLTYVRAGNR